MTDNEKLIEEAAKAIYETRDDAYDLDVWEQLDRTQQERYVCDARAALAVFQKAHTPTGNERKAWRDEAIRRYPHAEVAKYMRQALQNAFIEGAKFAAGFRRSEVPMRSILLTDHKVQHLSHPQSGKWGEPSKAQVEAGAKTLANRMMDGPWEDLLDTIQEDYRHDTRAVLRAASAERGGGA